MRPEDFSPGNAIGLQGNVLVGGASMRPEDFSPGNVPSSGSIGQTFDLLQ